MANFEAATAVAEKLPGATRISATSYAVWAHGADKWVCPDCLAVSDSGPPLASHYCRCGATLAP
jgi:hypothetical protein